MNEPEITILYDGQGRQREFWEGIASYETLVSKVSALLDETLVTQYEEVEE